MSLIDRLHKGDELHREAAAALEHFELFSEFVLSDNERSLAFVQWQRAKSSPKDPAIIERDYPAEQMQGEIVVLGVEEEVPNG